jgi:hypothetical protein
VWSLVKMFDGTYRELLLMVDLFFGLAAGMEMERAELEIMYVSRVAKLSHSKE